MVIMLEKPLSTAMNARLLGSGKEVMVLAHGYGGDQSVWEQVAPVLAQTHRVLVFDWSFSGAIKDPNTLYDAPKYATYDGYVQDLIELLIELDLASVVFVGHSMAGMIGCLASIKRPDLFTKLILIGASPRYMNSDDYAGGFDINDIEQLFTSIESNYLEWTSVFAPLVVDPKDVESVEKFKKCLRRMKPEIALSTARTVFLSDERETLEKVVTPCTIVQMTNDVVVPVTPVNYMKRKIKGELTVEMIEGVGHFPHLTAPLKLLEIFDRVMSSV